MENWGLVTYREVDLLIDPITASSNQKQRVAVVVTHELAHQYVFILPSGLVWLVGEPILVSSQSLILFSKGGLAILSRWLGGMTCG